MLAESISRYLAAAQAYRGTQAVHTSRQLVIAVFANSVFAEHLVDLVDAHAHLQGIQTKHFVPTKKHIKYMFCQAIPAQRSINSATTRQAKHMPTDFSLNI